MRLLIILIAAALPFGASGSAEAHCRVVPPANACLTLTRTLHHGDVLQSQPQSASQVASLRFCHRHRRLQPDLPYGTTVRSTKFRVVGKIHGRKVHRDLRPPGGKFDVGDKVEPFDIEGFHLNPRVWMFDRAEFQLLLPNDIKTG